MQKKFHKKLFNRWIEYTEAVNMNVRDKIQQLICTYYVVQHGDIAIDFSMLQRFNSVF